MWNLEPGILNLESEFKLRFEISDLRFEIQKQKTN